MISLEGGVFEISRGIQAARSAEAPIVALESTILTHGMPYPANLETALAVEAVVREEGAIPATVGVIHGRVQVGLSEREIRHLAKAQGVAKASRRDVAALYVKGADAGTTVAVTMMAAAYADIPIFATGGIGGVHRGADRTFDVSADLQELARTQVAVVCSGCKSILDIPKTLEVLETLGIPVLGYATDDFPAFFARSSGCKVDYRFDTPQELGEVIVVHGCLNQKANDWSRRGSGLLIANPIPESDAIASDVMEGWIEAAVQDAEAAGVGGKNLTPFLLSRINEMTGGASLTANIALIKSNARLAAKIAVSMLRAGRQLLPNSIERGVTEVQDLPPIPKLIVIGDVMNDLIVRPDGPVEVGADRSARIESRPGGSGANTACWLSVEGVRTVFAGRVGRADCEHHTGLLGQFGVEPALAVDDNLPTGSTITLLSPDGERSFLTDRGANDALCKADLPDSLLAGLALVHVSGYSLFSEGPCAAVLRLLGEARQRSIPFSVDAASHSRLTEVGAERFLEWIDGAEWLFANQAEAAVLTGAARVEDQLAILARQAASPVVKRGSAGASDSTERQPASCRPLLRQSTSSTRPARATPSSPAFWLPVFGEKLSACRSATVSFPAPGPRERSVAALPPPLRRRAGEGGRPRQLRSRPWLPKIPSARRTRPFPTPAPPRKGEGKIADSVFHAAPCRTCKCFVARYSSLNRS